MIEIKNFSKTYNGIKKAVDDISFKVNDGEIFGFIGHNGAGKTTTIKSLVGILDFEEGDILVLLTDGMQEIFSPDGEMFGTERIIKTIHKHRECSSKKIIEALYKAGTDFSQTPTLDDDFTCIIIKVKH